MSRSNLRVFERIRLLHFRIWVISAREFESFQLGESDLRRRVRLPEDCLDRLHNERSSSDLKGSKGRLFNFCHG